MPLKEKTGIVVSDKMQKTIVVAIETKATHKKYGKIVSRTRKYKAHDEKNECKIGDLVNIIESRPISKTKRWSLKMIKQKSSRLDISNIGD